jgi:hypothetical protein
MRDQLPHRYDHAWLLAEIVDGYYRTEMSTTRDDNDERAERKREQDDRAHVEDRFAREAGDEADGRAHRRRADKAAYLRDKLAEAERSERS